MNPHAKGIGFRHSYAPKKTVSPLARSNALQKSAAQDRIMQR
jgi:hypothetical protein